MPVLQYNPTNVYKTVDVGDDVQDIFDSVVGLGSATAPKTIVFLPGEYEGRYYMGASHVNLVAPYGGVVFSNYAANYPYTQPGDLGDANGAPLVIRNKTIATDSTVENVTVTGFDFANDILGTGAPSGPEGGIIQPTFSIGVNDIGSTIDSNWNNISVRGCRFFGASRCVSVWGGHSERGVATFMGCEFRSGSGGVDVRSRGRVFSVGNTYLIDNSGSHLLYHSRASNDRHFAIGNNVGATGRMGTLDASLDHVWSVGDVMDVSVNTLDNFSTNREVAAVLWWHTGSLPTGEGVGIDIHGASIRVVSSVDSSSTASGNDYNALGGVSILDDADSDDQTIVDGQYNVTNCYIDVNQTSTGSSAFSTAVGVYNAGGGTLTCTGTTVRVANASTNSTPKAYALQTANRAGATIVKSIVDLSTDGNESSTGTITAKSFG